MNLYYDSEFTGLHQHSTFISLAFIDDEGRAFYAEFTDYRQEQCDAWIQEHVLQHTRWLSQNEIKPQYYVEGQLTSCLGDSKVIRDALINWLSPYAKIEVWADCLAWDWVLFCQLFGGAFHIPSSIFYLPFDLVTLFKAKGLDPNQDRETFAQLPPNATALGQRHNALRDAQVLRACYRRLQAINPIE